MKTKQQNKALDNVKSKSGKGSKASSKATSRASSVASTNSNVTKKKGKKKGKKEHAAGAEGQEKEASGLPALMKKIKVSS